MSDDPLQIFVPGFSGDDADTRAREVIDAWRDEWHLEPEPELDGANSEVYESLVRHVANALRAATPPPAVTSTEYSECFDDAARVSRVLNYVAVTEAGEQERETGTNGHVHKFGIVKVSPELGHSYRRCSECLLSVHLKGHDPARCELCASERRELPPFCAVHSEIEKRDGLELEIGNNCIACSLHERSLLLGMLEPFAAPDGSQDSPTVLRGIINAAAPPSTSAAIRAAAHEIKGEVIERVRRSFNSALPIPAEPIEDVITTILSRWFGKEETDKSFVNEFTEATIEAHVGYHHEKTFHDCDYAVCAKRREMIDALHTAAPGSPSPGEPRDAASDNKLTDLQRAVIEHDDDMARLDRNTLPEKINEHN